MHFSRLTTLILIVPITTTALSTQNHARRDNAQIPVPDRRFLQTYSTSSCNNTPGVPSGIEVSNYFQQYVTTQPIRAFVLLRDFKPGELLDVSDANCEHWIQSFDVSGYWTVGDDGGPTQFSDDVLSGKECHVLPKPAMCFQSKAWGNAVGV